MTEESLFAAAASLPPGDDRDALLDRECAGVPDLRARMNRLLNAHDVAAGILDRDKPTEPTLLRSEVPDDAEYGDAHAGTVIGGRYKLLERIGEGGMGAVWVADQMQPVRRKVALKLIKAGMDTRSVIARFEAERQALALMDHPNIAKVLDGGVTDHGRPYFVMEYVKGVPLTEYCDAARLTVEERLALFIPVCQAVQHAHQKGIIHRDLKPTNILVCLYDGHPVPKVIDFGLAKAMHQPLTERTIYTSHGSMMGTPLYMSPEQAELNNLDIDTRTDIYALGVVLYELLTGTTPLEKQALQQAAWHEMVRLIKDVDPPRPSTRLSASGTLPSIAAQRRVEPIRLSRLLRRDLDWIVMKALEKDRGRRYETANGFARDIERYLRDEPVEATPPSASYRFQKWARRYRRQLAAGILCAVAIAAGGVGLTRGYLVAREAARVARIDRDKAIEAEKTSQANAAQAAAAEKTARANAEQAAAAEKVARNNAAEAEALTSVFEGVCTNASSQILEAGQWRRQTFSEALKQSEWTISEKFRNLPAAEARFRSFLGKYHDNRGEWKASIEHYQRVLELCNLTVGPADRFTLQNGNALARIYAHQEPEKGFSLLKNLIATSLATYGADDDLTINLQASLGEAYLRTSEVEKGIELQRQLYDFVSARHSPHSVKSMRAAWNLVSALTVGRRHSEAIPILENLAQILAEREFRYEETGFTPGQLEEALGDSYAMAQGLDKARDWYLEIQRRQAASAGRNHYSTRLTTLKIAQLEWRKGDMHAAESSLRALVEQPPSENGHFVDLAGREATYELAKLLIESGRPDEAEPLVEDFRRAVQKYDPTNSQLARADLLIAETRVAQQRYEDAEPLLIGCWNEFKQQYFMDWGAQFRPSRQHLPTGRVLQALIAIYQARSRLPQSLELQDAIAIQLLEDPQTRPTAIAVYRQIVEGVPNDPWFWYRLTQAELFAGKPREFRADFALMLERFGKTEDPAIAARVLYSCLHVANAISDDERLLKLGQAAARDPGGERVLGACLVRTGGWSEAVDRIREHGQKRAWDHLFLAIAHHHLGMAEKAREYLARGTGQIESDNYPWDEKLACEILREEAKTIIAP